MRVHPAPRASTQEQHFWLAPRNQTVKFCSHTGGRCGHTAALDDAFAIWVVMLRTPRTALREAYAMTFSTCYAVCAHLIKVRAHARVHRARLENMAKWGLLRHQPRHARHAPPEHFREQNRPIVQPAPRASTQEQVPARALALRARLVSTEQPGLLPLPRRHAQTVPPASTRRATERRSAWRAVRASTHHRHCWRPRA